MANRVSVGVWIYTVTVLVLDQVTKQFIRQTMELGESIPIIGNFFRLTYIENSGIAFGINFTGGPPIFTGASIIATLGIVIYLWYIRESNTLFKVSLAIILGGAIGNLIDRIRFGYVSDFLHLSLGKYSWPVFNIADSAVTIGMILFLYYSFFIAEQKKSTLET